MTVPFIEAVGVWSCVVHEVEVEAHTCCPFCVESYEEAIPEIEE